jgi:MFS family permease
VIKRLGFNRSYYLASLIFAVGCVGLGITVGFWSWLSWRFIAGVGCAMIWVVVESALVQRHFPQPRSSAGGVHDGLLRRYRTGPADGQ